jgi:Large ribosomal RNA subunit accumulation protein YceD
VIDKTSPWHATVAVADVPEEGLHRELEASEAEREAIARLAGLRELPRLGASFDLVNAGGGNIRVTGRVQASAGQTCVVTLEPLTNELDEEVDVVFSSETAPPAAAKAEDDDDDGMAEDPPEPIVNGTIDLGVLATEFLMLGLDPYPRKAGAVFEPVIAAVDPADHPFAALGALKNTDSAAKPGKSGSKTKGK